MSGDSTGNMKDSRKRRKKRKSAKELDFIVDCGSRGDHLLFSPNMIRSCFNLQEKDLSNLFEENFDKVQGILEDALEISDADERRKYIKNLPENLQNALIYGYFELIGGNILESGGLMH